MNDQTQITRDMTLRFFAWMRERTGFGETTVSVPSTVTTVRELVLWLKAQDESYARAFVEPRVVRAALDQKHVTIDTELGDAREVAFFPPMTGG